MKDRTIDLVAGARPNFMKLAPVMKAIDSKKALKPRIVHTGQHYDYGMNGVFFEELGIPEPDVHLEVGSGTHGVQTARILERYEAHLLKTRPAATVVFGDVNSTIACALAAAKLGVRVVHVEAGLRSFDRTMPEEINRMLTDAIAGLLLVSEPSGMENLSREGNVMIDTLKNEYALAKSSQALEEHRLIAGQYVLMTLHRPSNVDDPEILRRLLEVIIELSEKIPFILPVHPRTRDAAQKAGLTDLLFYSPAIKAIEPLPYRDNLWLMANSRMVLTDSGGMQEETTFLKVPCLTLRENTERPITLDKGTSRLVGNDPKRIRAAFEDVLAGRWPKGETIPMWDGHASERVAEGMCDWLGL
ncbi:MAG: UDP-N-acetylglucosamine 2-epimerase (non-hydrolyzing) [Deltaproteobacteria bacterium]|nr:UDP-N-acetylglucosamine 2-epimerase (non-hydrolyzing) [Deltaproteobacteria bacterium]